MGAVRFAGEKNARNYENAVFFPMNAEQTCADVIYAVILVKLDAMQRTSVVIQIFQFMYVCHTHV